MSAPSQQASLAALAALLSIDVTSVAGVGLQLTGTWSGTVSFEASIDGQNFVAFNMVPSNSATPASSATANGCFSANCAGYACVRARMSAFTSGAAIVTLLNEDGAGRF